MDQPLPGATSGIRIPPRRSASLTILLAAMFAACSSGANGPPATPTAATVAQATPSLAGGLRIDIGGRSLFIVCSGTGSPTVILEAGMTGDTRTWEQVRPGINPRSRVCAYDRANIATSDPAPRPRTAATAVADLHALLAAAHIDGPYVLVGFSMGGLISQLYAATYPGEIHGLVLIESNTRDEAKTFNAHLTQAQIDADRVGVLDNPEGFDPFASFTEAQSAGPLPQVPLVVISAGKSDGWPDGWDPKVFDPLHDQLQAELVQLVSGGRQVIAAQSSHDIPREAPDLVVEAINSVLGAAS